MHDKYSQELVKAGVTTEQKVDKIKSGYLSIIEQEFNNSDSQSLKQDAEGRIQVESYTGNWAQMSMFHNKDPVDTRIPVQTLKEIGQVSVDIPKHMAVHSTVQKGHIKGRLDKLENGVVDWSTAESMAFGSLLKEGYTIRLCGEDSVRGTFT